MYALAQSAGLSGLSGFTVTVETDLGGGLPAFEIVGLPDAAVRESRERVRAAIKNAGYSFPVSRITVNLSPADKRKEGALYDLPIALSILAASGEIPREALKDITILGELALDGAVRPVPGVLPMVIDAKSRGISSFIIPDENGQEAACVPDVAVYPAGHLKELVAHFKGSDRISPLPCQTWNLNQNVYGADFSEIRGQQGAKRAAEVAVAGGHNLLMIGTPGSGKTMLARSIPSILPDLTFEEALEITKIHSVAGLVRGGLMQERPFRAPHHGASAAALIGGGTKAMPGEISLAHMGVLFLDELPEYQRPVLEALRQPLEDGFVTISRAAATSTYPADFILVAAMNPCPCGNYGSQINPCRCTPAMIDRYRGRLSGPLLDRIDLMIEMPEVRFEELSAAPAGETSKEIRERVNAARKIQRERFAGEGIFTNAEMSAPLIRKYCKPTGRSETLLQQAFTKLRLSARAYNRILKVARTIADLAGSEEIQFAHYAEAIQYRSLDGGRE
ncbi:MAG: YifB family Mg chelatase-like AAA ATPase [Clostridia bacterium]|nr:YifB family Mg chelatase-like AAA ATPase [Clostridia bacterium]